MKFRLLWILLLSLTLDVIAQGGGANVTDANNLRQGFWSITNAEKNLPGYGADQVVEEGYYRDGLKQGEWKKYFPNGSVEHVLTFKNNKLDGLATFYYKNGKVRESGIWKDNRWIGEYKYYWKNGNLRNEWKYDETGKRNGVQRYYYENGQVKIEGAWENGKESGPLVEYYEDGSLKSERYFADGKIDAAKTKEYKKAEQAPPKEITPSDSVSGDRDSMFVKKYAPEDEKAKPFDGNGYHEFRNKEGQIVRKGNFRNGFLADGQLFKYSDSGKLIKTYFYKNGKVIRVVNH